MTQSKAFEYLIENKENCRIAMGMLTSSEESRPIWEALRETLLNLQQAIAQDNYDEVVESIDRSEVIWESIKKDIKKA